MKPISRRVILMLGVTTALFLIGLFISNTVFAQEDVLYNVADKQPEFKSGIQGLTKAIADSLNYPKSKAHVEGSVFVEFIVEKDGSGSNFRVIKGIGDLYDQEAVRVIRAISVPGEWIPGEVGGKIVRTRFVLPIKFRQTERNP